MAVDPESMLGTPSGYASPQQLEMARQLAQTLMQPQQGQFMQHWSQPMAQIVRALLGAKMMNQAGEQERNNAAGMVGLGGPQMAESGAIRSDAPPRLAGGQPQPPVPPMGQPGQATPGPSASPQMPGGGPSPQMMHPALITRHMVETAVLSGHPMASKLMEMYLQQQQPQTIQYGDATYSYIPAHPEIPPQLVPQPHEFKEGGGEGVPRYGYQIQRTPRQGIVQGPLGQAGGAPPAAGGPPQQGGPAPSVGAGAAAPSDFGSATQAAIDLAGRKTQAQTEGKSYASEHIGLRATAENLAQQMPILQVARSILNDPSFYSGTAADAVLKLRRAGVSVNQEAMDAATPMEVFNKVISANILQQTNQLKAEAEAEGFQNNRLFRQQVGLMEKAAQNADNTPSGNMYLTNFLMWQAQRARKIADMADQYATDHGGVLDAGWSKQMRDNMFDNPEFQLPKEFKFPHPAAGEVGTTKTIGNKTYYQRNGKWFDNPEGK